MKQPFLYKALTMAIISCLCLTCGASERFVPQPAPVKKKSYLSGWCVVDYENKYIRWEHDSKTGNLVGAYVLNDSQQNLFAERPDFQIVVQTAEGPVVYRGTMAGGVSFGNNYVHMYYSLRGESGQELPASIVHTIRYGEWGDAEHNVHLEFREPVANVLKVSPVVMTTTDRFDTYGAKEMRVCGTDKWALSGVADWKSLKTDASPLYSCSRVPLYMLMFERGGAGIEFAVTSDIAAWEALGDKQGATIVHDEKRHAYRFTVSAFDSKEPATLQGSYDFNYRLTLPFIRKYITPIRPAAPLFYFSRGFDKRWPTDDDFKSMREAGLTLLRLHNDCDNMRNGIFWRDAVYPPYPPEAMAEMDDCLARAAKYGIAVVPYFSLKEMHPEAAEFKQYSKDWAKLNAPGDGVWITRWEDLVFGGVMCLKSGWLRKRQDTISEVLKNHTFKGVYFDWCTALECTNVRHCRRHHWDIDEHIKLLRWSNVLKGAKGEQYMHMTHVPLLIAENMATLLLTEESSFPEIGPCMFTPHVHFMNTAPRSICNMLGAHASVENNRKLAMAALLHHATVADSDSSVLDLYKENREWMDKVTSYNRHYAPGEGHTEADNKNVGVAFYEAKNGSCMSVLANLSNEEVTVKYACHGKYAHQEGTVTIQPLQMMAIPSSKWYKLW